MDARTSIRHTMPQAGAFRNARYVVLFCVWCVCSLRAQSVRKPITKKPKAAAKGKAKAKAKGAPPPPHPPTYALTHFVCVVCFFVSCDCRQGQG